MVRSSHGDCDSIVLEWEQTVCFINVSLGDSSVQLSWRTPRILWALIRKLGTSKELARKNYCVPLQNCWVINSRGWTWQPINLVLPNTSGHSEAKLENHCMRTMSCFVSLPFPAYSEVLGLVASESGHIFKGSPALRTVSLTLTTGIM